MSSLWLVITRQVDAGAGMMECDHYCTVLAFPTLFSGSLRTRKDFLNYDAVLKLKESKQNIAKYSLSRVHGNTTQINPLLNQPPAFHFTRNQIWPGSTSFQQWVPDRHIFLWMNNAHTSSRLKSPPPDPDTGNNFSNYTLFLFAFFLLPIQ